MDYKNAKQKLSELRDSLDQVLGGKSEGPSREDAEEALKAARDGAKRAKKSLLGKIKDLPVLDKISQLGAAGTVAVSTAAVTQTNIAVDETEVFVASVANDVVHERLRFPPVINNFVDFSALDSWGREVMQEKVAEVRAEVAKVEAKVVPAKLSPATESNTQEDNPKEESADSPKEDAGNPKGAKEVKESTQEKEKVQEKEAEESTPKKDDSDGELDKKSSEADKAEPMPEEDSDKSADEIDEVKPHSELEVKEPEQPSILPEDSRVVSPAGPKRV